MKVLLKHLGRSADGKRPELRTRLLQALNLTEEEGLADIMVDGVEEGEVGDEESDGSSSEEDYEVEELRGTRKRRGVTEYLVHWVGYGSDEDTWEPGDDIDADLVKEYKRHKR